MTSFNWVIQSMTCEKQAAGQTDVVVRAVWFCEGQQVVADGVFRAGQSGVCTFTYTPGETFTPYDQLTQSQVLGWCWASGVDQGVVESEVDAQITAAIANPYTTLPLPWMTPAA